MRDKKMSIALGEPFVVFIEDLVESGRYKSASDAVRYALQLLEQHEARVQALRSALEKGERSPVSESYSLEATTQKVRDA